MLDTSWDLFLFPLNCRLTNHLTGPRDNQRQERQRFSRTTFCVVRFTHFTPDKEMCGECRRCSLNRRPLCGRSRKHFKARQVSPYGNFPLLLLRTLSRHLSKNFISSPFKKKRWLRLWSMQAADPSRCRSSAVSEHAARGRRVSLPLLYNAPHTSAAEDCRS